MRAELTVFHDSECPLCAAEVRQLRELDTAMRLDFIDIHDTGSMSGYPGIDPQRAGEILHGMLPDGTIMLGLDVTVMAWQSVGRHRWLRVLRWPVIRTLADLAYLAFARHRYTLSLLLTGRSRCQACRVKN